MFFKAPYFGLWHWCWKTKLHSVALLDFGWRPKNASQESFSFAVISKTTSTYKSLYKSDELQRIVFNTDWALNHHNIAPHFVSVWVIQRSCWQDLNPSAVCFWKKKCLNTKVHWLSSAMWDDENNFKQMETENVTCHMNFHLMGRRQVDLSEDLKPQVCTCCVCTWLFLIHMPAEYPWHHYRHVCQFWKEWLWLLSQSIWCVWLNVDSVPQPWFPKSWDEALNTNCIKSLKN